MLRVEGGKPVVKSEINRILIRATNWVGDMVMSLPALEAVRKNFPSSSITVLARPWVIPLLKNHSAVDHVIPFRKGRGYHADLMEMGRIAVMLRRMRFDMAVLFQNAFEAALLAFLAGIRFRIGYNTGGRGFLLTHAVIRDGNLMKRHQVEYYLSILRAMGWEADTAHPALSVTEKEMEDVNSLLEPEGIQRFDRILGLSPGAIFGPAKRWPSRRFATIGDWAIERWGYKVVIMGSRGERDICESLAGFMRHESLNLCGRTDLGRAIALIRRCSLFVTNDSGLMHVAAALGVPMVAIFGSTDHVATGPVSPKARVVRKEAECAPCLKPVCPEDFRCMLDISPEDVWRELEILMEGIK